MRHVFPLLLLAAFATTLATTLLASCSQSLPPVLSEPNPNAPTDFFWSTAQLDTGLDYYVLRQGSGTDHALSSKDGVHVQDGSIGVMAFRVRSLGDTVAIDSIGANSIFSLPTGYYFAGDSDLQQHGPLKLLIRSGLHTGGSWQAGTLAGIGLGQGVTISADVLDHVDTLLIPAIGPTAPAAFGESYIIRYAHDSAGGAMDPSFPLYWKVYFTRALGPVLIEEYLDSTGTYSLESQAVLRRGR